MKMWSYIKKTANIIGIILGILGIILSIYFYYKSEKVRDISYSLIKPTSIVYDRQSSTPSIRVIRGDSQVISGNVYLLTGTIWNSGDLPILKEDVRKGLVIRLGGCEQIVDFRIISQNDSSISKFSLNPVNNNTLKTDWMYFDPNFGFRFQIIYVGNANPECEVDGKILGVKRIRLVEGIQRPSYGEIFNSLSTWLLVILFPILWLIILKQRESKFERWLYNAFKVFLILCSVLAFLASITYLILKFSPSPNPLD